MSAGERHRAYVTYFFGTRKMARGVQALNMQEEVTTDWLGLLSIGENYLILHF